jgi:hypothetical protein
MDQTPLPATKTNKPRKTILIIASDLVILVIGFFIGYYFNSGNTSYPALGILGGNSKNSYDAGWKAAQEKIEQSGLLRPEPAEIFTVTGTITSVAGNKITLKAEPTVTNPLAEQAPETRTVTVTAETKILKLTPKTPEEIAKESEAFRKSAAELEPGATPPNPPSPFGTKEIKITDLKAGDTISVTAETNIKMAAEFAAKEISINVAPERPAPPTP